MCLALAWLFQRDSVQCFGINFNAFVIAQCCLAEAASADDNVTSVPTSWSLRRRCVFALATCASVSSSHHSSVIRYARVYTHGIQHQQWTSIDNVPMDKKKPISMNKRTNVDTSGSMSHLFSSKSSNWIFVFIAKLEWWWRWQRRWLRRQRRQRLPALTVASLNLFSHFEVIRLCIVSIRQCFSSLFSVQSPSLLTGKIKIAIYIRTDCLWCL